MTLKDIEYDWNIIKELYLKNVINETEALGKINELREKMGFNGSRYFQEHYTWPIIEKKYMSLIRQLSEET